VSEDSRVLERTHADLQNDVALIAAEFLGGFQKVLEIDTAGSARTARSTRRRARRHGASRARGSPSSPAAVPG
jgi:hypothetical protein